MSEREKYRKFFFTWNNYTEDSVKRVRDKMKECTYGIFGYEVGEKCGTPHLQGAIFFKNERSLNKLRKDWKGADVRIALGEEEHCKVYCSKEGKFEEFGILPKGQGHRSDLDLFRDRIIGGERDDDLCMEDPYKFHMYGRTMNKIEDLCMRKKFRTEMTKGIWYYGPTNVGKSHKAFEGFNPSTHYVVPNDNGWWDGYTQQDIVIFNDFRGEVSYNFMLQLVDKWPFNVKRRNREPMPFISKTVIITSSLDPAQVFCRREAEDHIEQLLRRFTIVNLGAEVLGGNNGTPSSVSDYIYCL